MTDEGQPCQAQCIRFHITPFKPGGKKESKIRRFSNFKFFSLLVNWGLGLVSLLKVVQLYFDICPNVTFYRQGQRK